MPDLESIRRELENLDYSDWENIKRELQKHESLEGKMHFLSITGMAIKHEFAAAEKEWVDAGKPIPSPLWENKERWGGAVGTIQPRILKTYEKYRCWLRLRTGKELWSGTVIDLDLKNIRDDDLELFEPIEERLNSLPDYKARIDFLKRFMVLLRHESGMGENDYGSASKGARHLYERCASAVRMIERVAELEMAPDTPAANADEEKGSEDTPESKDSTTAQQVMLLYYLVIAANGGKNINRSALGRLLEFLTGKKQPTTKRYWQNPTGGPGREKSKALQKDRAVVRGLLEDLGLPHVVELLDRESA